MQRPASHHFAIPIACPAYWVAPPAGGWAATVIAGARMAVDSSLSGRILRNPDGLTDGGFDDFRCHRHQPKNKTMKTMKTTKTPRYAAAEATAEAPAACLALGLDDARKHASRIGMKREALTMGLAAIGLAMAQSVVAGTISWEVFDTSGPTDVSTVGDLVAAYTGHNDGVDITLNGVTFPAAGIPGLTSGSSALTGNRVPDLPAGDYYEFIRRSTYGSYTRTVTLTGLTVGEPYLVQVWYSDNPSDTTRLARLDAALPETTVDIHATGANHAGQYAIGTFTADAETQSFTTRTWNNGSATAWAQLNGLQLRHIRPVAQPRITLLSYDPADGSAEATIEGAPNTRFKLVEAADLNFSTPDQDPVPLLGATVGTLFDGIYVIADDNGEATVQFNLGTGPANFVRAETGDWITLASFDFEVNGQAFIPSGDWAWGTPASDNGEPNGQVNGGNGGSTGAWATSLGDGGAAVSGGITPTVESVLRSPNIVLTGITGARLAFAAAVDAAPGDTLEVVVRDAAADVSAPPLGTINPFPTTFPVNAAWQDLGPFDLPEDAANKTIYLEFRFIGADADYLGFYLDNVKISF